MNGFTPISASPTSPEAITIVTEPVKYTEKTLIEFSYTWKIENCNFRSLKLGERLCSVPFSTRANDSHKWRLIAYPCGFDAKNKNYVAIFLWLCESNEPNVQAMFDFSILNSKELKVNVVPSNGIYTFTKDHDAQSAHGCHQFISRETLTKKANTLMPDNYLTIVCDVRIVDTAEHFKETIETQPFKIPDCQMVDDIAALFENKKHSDLTIVVGNVEVPAHKSILAARSSVFATMVDNKKNRMDIPDTEYEVFREVLRYIYRGEVNNIDTLASPLLLAAFKYGLKRLTAMCEKSLSMNITIHNVGALLVIADFCKADQLKPRLINFISKHALQLKDNTAFQKVVKSQPQLIMEAFSLLASRVNGHPSD